eukprot:COSAG06_NODE_68_length_26072_cov_68.140377_18_plen_207_part_00
MDGQPIVGRLRLGLGLSSARGGDVSREAIQQPQLGHLLREAVREPRGRGLVGHVVHEAAGVCAGPKQAHAPSSALEVSRPHRRGRAARGEKVWRPHKRQRPSSTAVRAARGETHRGRERCEASQRSAWTAAARPYPRMPSPSSCLTGAMDLRSGSRSRPRSVSKSGQGQIIDLSFLHPSAPHTKWRNGRRECGSSVRNAALCSCSC